MLGNPATPSPCATASGLHHDHGFGQGVRRRAEERTLLVASITLVVMAIEIAAGWWTGSMALLADGIHMGGHAIALGLAAGGYFLARHYARDRRLSLGSGKIHDLAAYTSSLLLGASILWLALESAVRLLRPEPLAALEAMAVAVLGLVVNLVSAWVLVGAEGHAQAHGHDHDHAHHHPSHPHPQPGDPHATGDHNLRAALLHVLADAATSVAAILGLLGAWLWGWHWLDPLIALAAVALISRWTWGLLVTTSRVLLDAEGPAALRREATKRLEAITGGRVTDLHLWSVGQGGWTLVAAAVNHAGVTPEACRAALAGLPGLYHPVIELHPCATCSRSDDAD